MSDWIDSKRLMLSREGHTPIPITDLSSVELDRDTLEEVLRLTLNHIEDPTDKRNFEDMLTLYLEKVSEREVEFQHFFNKGIQLKEELESAQD